MHSINFDNLDEFDILASQHYKQKNFAKKKRIKIDNYYNFVTAILSQSYSACDKKNHNIQICMFREIDLN